MLISDWSSDVCSSDLLAKVSFKLVGLRDAITGSAGKTGAHGISLDLTRVADRQKQLTGRGKMQGRTPTDGTYDLHARALAPGPFYIDDFIALLQRQIDGLARKLVELAHGLHGDRKSTRLNSSH